LNGFYRTHLFQSCRPCDEAVGLKCQNDYALLKEGYWWKWENESHRLLYEQFTDNLKNESFRPSLRSNSTKDNLTLIEYPFPLPRPHKCPQNDTCIGGLSSLCSPGYEGPLCDVCGHGYYEQLKKCRKCPTKEWMAGQLSVMAVVVVIVITVVVWTSKRKSKNIKGRSSVDVILGRLKIVIGFYQVTFGVLEAFSYIKWPESLALIGKNSEMLQLNVLQIAPINCLFPNLKVDAFGGLLAMLAINAAAIVVAFAVYRLSKMRLKTLNKEEKLRKISQVKELVYRNLFFFLYVTYLSTCSKTANVLPLACREVCYDEKYESCQKFLRADLTVECTGEKYNRFVIVAFFAVFYIILLPTVAMVITWRQRKAVSKIENESNNETSDRKDHSTAVLRGLRFVYENYKPHAWYWELIETVRKVILTSGLILVGGESRAYIGLACVMSGLYGMLFALKKPIIDPFENKLMLSSLAVTFVNLGIGAVSRIPKERIPSSMDSYVDSVMFKVLVFGANSIVIGLLAGKHKDC